MNGERAVGGRLEDAGVFDGGTVNVSAGATADQIFLLDGAELDMQLDAKGKVEAYRAKARLSFKVER